MVMDLVDNHLILDTDYHPGFASTLRADRYIDVEYTFETLLLCHGLMAMF
jgi:hypothetical protein